MTFSVTHLRRALRTTALAALMATSTGTAATAWATEATPATAEPPVTTARQQLHRFAEGLDSLSVRFSQTVIDAEGQLLDEGGGTIAMRRPNLFRWSYEGEFPELIVADGERLWLYDQALEQVTVREQSARAGDSPLLLLTDPDSLDEQFQVTELGTIDGARLLELSPEGQDVEFDRILIAFENDRPVSMTMEDAFGMRTEIRFGELERNPGLATDLFTFTPPEGVDVVGDVGAE